MELTVLTYNILFNKGINHAKKLMQQYKPDVVCLQEVDTTLENLQALEDNTYALADYSNSFLRRGKLYGIATYYNKNILKLESSDSNDLPRGLYEMLILILRGFNRPRTILKMQFKFHNNTVPLWLYNIHLSHFSTNSLRMKQLRNFLKQSKDVIEDLESKVMIAGDFNFPYNRSQLEKVMEQHNLFEATKNIFYTFEANFLKFFSIRLKDDYILYRNVKVLETERIEERESDHYPILGKFEITP